VNRSWLDRFVSVGCHELSVNSTSIHLRNIRAVFNRAIDDGVTTCYPFRRFRIKTERVPVGNITAKQLAAIRDYPCDSWIAVYRDLFMLSFYLCGANAADMLQCRGLTNGRFVYRRKKTGRLYDLPVYPEAMRIIEKYRGKEYLLNIMDSHSDYHSFTAIWNANLKKIGPAEKVQDRLGKMRKVIYHPIVPGLTTYTARYTFASIAAEIDIPRDIIALCLGHAWADVTDRYISYGREKVDEAVRKVIDYVNSIHDKA
jgi:integrase